jgi:putative endonuclease
VKRDRNDTLVFVEVRVRRDARYGAAPATLGASKRQRLVFAARIPRQVGGPVAVPLLDVVAGDGERIASGCAPRSMRVGADRLNRPRDGVSYHR